jgi:DNA processing protein
MQSIDDNRLILALAIQRIPGLHPDERLVLWDLVDDELTLSLLLSSDVEAAIGRSRGGRPWSPDSYLEAALRDARFLARSGCRYIHFDDEAYPALLRETARPPFGLFARGGGFDPSTIAVSIVGTRMPTGRGLDASFAIARDLSAAGLSIVSGLARGIDAAAHRGALAGAVSGTGGSTCAVLPCGIDRIYPSGNRGLAAAILEAGGMIVSEFPPDTEPLKYRFPERNRIIAGLARACVVVEAPIKSGALITAEHALDEGRDVWVASGLLGGQRSAGIDRLAADGASVLSDSDELVADLRTRFGASDRPSGPKERSTIKAVGDRESLARDDARGV